MSSKEKSSIMPVHVGIIMDGNGRWAQKRGLPRTAGHKVGADVFEKIVRHAKKIGVKHLTVYAFSTENNNRPAEEIATIRSLFAEYLKKTTRFRKEDARMHFLGDMSWIKDEKLMATVNEIEEEYRLRKGVFTLNIAFNYGGRDEIIRAAKAIAKDYKDGALDINRLDSSIMSGYLYTSGQPDVDLVIRTSGEMRTSNFLLWQAAYAEYIFTDTLWPDFSTKNFDNALLEFASRDRRMGALKT